jgi:ureidoacrylate peracid hydrolase
MEPEIGKSALIIVDMQNDFLHPDGYVGHRRRENPNSTLDLPFLMAAIPQVARLAEAFRQAGRPVIYLAHAVKPDYSDAQFPYWRLGLPRGGNRTFVIEGSWGAQIVDDLKPRGGEHVVTKKGFDGFSNTPLDTILRRMGVSTCVVSGVVTSVCVSSTVRSAVEHNYRMILVGDATADRDRDTHGAELKTMARTFADVLTTGEVVAMLADAPRG